MSYWKQFEHGMLSREAVRVLVGYTETAADQIEGFVSVQDLKKNWEIKGVYPYLVSNDLGPISYRAAKYKNLLSMKCSP